MRGDRPRRRNVVVIAASAGGVTALRVLAAGLPADLPAAVFVVIHLLPSSPSRLPHIVSRAGPLPAADPKEHEPITHGRVLVAPPDWHMLVGRRHVHLDHGPPELGYRPSADVLFHSAARNHGDRVIGVVLTGLLGDGASGLAAIVHGGGIGIVQDPSEAEFSAMPERAIDLAAPQHVVRLADIGREIVAALDIDVRPAIDAVRG